MTASFVDALLAAGPAPDRAEALGLYGWLIGRWRMDAILHAEDGATTAAAGEIHFAWVLEGRAIQDVWILPARPRPAAAPGFYGTTLRIYDPGLDAWHILWIDPVKQLYTQQIGRAQGRDIVQEGTDGAGTPMRWRFTEIAPDSFLWLGEIGRPGGGWRLQAEFRARRA